MGARDVYSLAPFLLCSPRGGPVRCLTLVTLSAVVEAFLGNSDCATAPLFPSGQMMAPPSTGVAGLPGRRVGTQHRCAPTIIWSGGFLGATRRGWATHRVGDASRGGRRIASPLRYGRVGFLGAWHRCAGAMRRAGGRCIAGGDAPRGVGDAPQWATHRVSPTWQCGGGMGA